MGMAKIGIRSGFPVYSLSEFQNVIPDWLYVTNILCIYLKKLS